MSTIFEKIARREIPAEIVWENELFLAFLDINPKSKGHTLVIPKKPYPWVLDVPEFGQYWEAAKEVALKIKKALKPAYISFQTFGVEVPHAHIHIVPFYSLTEKYERYKATPEELKEVGEQIRRA